MDMAINHLVDRHPVVSVDLIRAFERADTRPEGWTAEDAERAVDRYVRFLLLAAKYKGLPQAPTRDIDFIWHLHMLHPSAYFADCQRLFGTILDHDGGFGKGEGELPKLKAVFIDTAERWEKEYDEPYVAMPQKGQQLEKCWHDCQGRCWHACASD